MKITVNSLEELESFAQKFSKCLKGNEILLLNGNLAAGKTTFTKFLVKSISPDLADEVNSPTFTVMNVYETEKFPIYHIDLYRVKEFDITDIIGNGLIIVEWAEYMNLENLNDVPVITLNFRIIDENKRTIELIADKRLEDCFNFI